MIDASLVEYALCRQVADGWLVLDRGPYREMRDAAKQAMRHEFPHEGTYRAIRTRVAVGYVLECDRGAPPIERQTTLDGRRTLPKRDPRPAKPQPDGARQLALLHHLDDLPGQGTMFETDGEEPAGSPS